MIFRYFVYDLNFKFDWVFFEVKGILSSDSKVVCLDIYLWFYFGYLICFFLGLIECLFDCEFLKFIGNERFIFELCKNLMIMGKLYENYY